jgi:hypothetical protein
MELVLLAEVVEGLEVDLDQVEGPYKVLGVNVGVQIADILNHTSLQHLVIIRNVLDVELQ